MISIVIVYGDVGHSPRMQNHIRQLLSIGHTVILAGYAHSNLPKDLSSNSSLSFISIIDPPRLTQFGRFIGMSFRLLMLLLNSLSLIWILYMRARKYKKRSIVIIQNPPSLPSHLVGFAISKMLGMKFIIDWHNFGFTLLGIKADSGVGGGPIRWIAKFFELEIGKFLGDYHLVVSMAMSNFLTGKGFKNVTVLYDRPVRERFKAISDPMHKKVIRQNLFKKYFKILNFEKKINLIISSTSWTEDENFNYLLDSLIEIGSNNNDDQFAFLITGKGAGKGLFEKKIEELCLPPKIEVRCVWLSSEDYVNVLASSDLGICLHESSSGLDLPMKVVDMISVNLKIAALYYECLEELLDKERCSLGASMFFKNSKELSNIILKVPLHSKDIIQYPIEESFDKHWSRKLSHLFKKN